MPPVHQSASSEPERAVPRAAIADDPVIDGGDPAHVPYPARIPFQGREKGYDDTVNHPVIFGDQPVIRARSVQSEGNRHQIQIPVKDAVKGGGRAQTVGKIRCRISAYNIRKDRTRSPKTPPPKKIPLATTIRTGSPTIFSVYANRRASSGISGAFSFTVTVPSAERWRNAVPGVEKLSETVSLYHILPILSI